ncbi:PHD finger protein 12-like [Xyrauchen texanus]|uniref:PHD finger protein 12-like n=1 Tax=Xyrauchen texanus TaxID=154827 RepID=UPI0022424658|nr:PHD finger protein 12-like [Xyrauchen texanus]
MWDKMETPKILYDLDTSGGLMEQIQQLLAPPRSEDGEKRRKPERETRRGGRATNHDTCDSCHEGGDLLCCDHCPAAFHLQCCNPPLSREMLPPGDWMCHRCCMRKKKREQKTEQVNGVFERQLSKHSSSPAPELELGTLRLDGLPSASSGGLRLAVAQVRLLDRRASSRPGTPTSNASTDTLTPSEHNDVDEYLMDGEEDVHCSESESVMPRLKKPFQLLIAAAMERNPTQFQLPTELTCTTSLPGSSKRRRKEEAIGKNVKRPQHELDPSGLVPLPVKVCFTCTKSCRVAPLIQCDYCALLFHMDCLDPPLTAMPTGRWMCPNHVEHMVLNQKNMTLSTRCQLFDQFQDRLSQHAVKVDFLRWVHRQHHPNRRGVRHIKKKTLKVPNSIKSHYQNPPVLVDQVGLRNGELSTNCFMEQEHSSPAQHLTSVEEQEEWLRHVIALQCSIMKHLSAKQMSSSHQDLEHTDMSDMKTQKCVETQELCLQPSGTPVGPRGAPLLHSQAPDQPKRPCQGDADSPVGKGAGVNGPVVCEDEAPHKPCSPSKPQTPIVTEPALPNHVDIKTESSSLLSSCTQRDITSSTSLASDSPALHHGSAVGNSSGLNSSLSAQTKENKVSPDVMSVGKGSVLPSSIGSLYSYIKNAVQGDGEVEINMLDEELIRLLAWQRIQQLISPKSSLQSLSKCGISPAVTASLSKPSLQTDAQKRDVQSRAVLCPLTGKGTAVSMCYRTLYIGTGAEMDVCLTNYGHCNYVSGKHACIFYDENTKHYELLNYSEHGTTVDNVLYSCDFSDKPNITSPSGLASKVQNSIRGNRSRKPLGEVCTEAVLMPAGGMMSSQAQGGSKSPCNCKASSSSLIGGSGAGWEGTALLHHSSCIKVGCMQFLFSITEFANNQPKKEMTSTIRSQEETEVVDIQTPKLHQIPLLKSKSVS